MVGEEEVSIYLAWTHQFQFAGYYAAAEKGFYTEEGLEVTRSWFIASPIFRILRLEMYFIRDLNKSEPTLKRDMSRITRNIADFVAIPVDRDRSIHIQFIFIFN